MHMMNMKCIHVRGARMLYVRWGWVGKKNFEPYVLPKWQHVNLVMSISQSEWTTFMNEAQLRSIVTPHNFVLPNNPLRFETTKCSKQRIEQASIRTLFPKCVHKLGSPRFVLEAVSWSTAIAGHVLSPAQGAALSSKGFLSFQFMKCSWLDSPVEGPTRRRGPEEQEPCSKHVMESL